MKLDELLKDKTSKPKQKTETISAWLLDGTLPVDELIAFAERQKDPAKATCIEAVEYCTKQRPGLANEAVLLFVTKALAEKAPRLKWESARVIGNIAHLFPSKMDEPIRQLLVNARHEGTVVRWSSAYALGEILKIKSKHNKSLMPVIEALSDEEQKNSIKKIYAAAIRNTSR